MSEWRDTGKVPKPRSIHRYWAVPPFWRRTSTSTYASFLYRVGSDETKTSIWVSKLNLRWIFDILGFVCDNSRPRKRWNGFQSKGSQDELCRHKHIHNDHDSKTYIVRVSVPMVLCSSSTDWYCTIPPNISYGAVTKRRNFSSMQRMKTPSK